MVQEPSQGKKQLLTLLVSNNLSLTISWKENAYGEWKPKHLGVGDGIEGRDENDFVPL